MTAALGTDGLAVLLRNHGSLCCGRDLPAAMNAAAYVEEAAQVAYYASALGRFHPLGEADIRACEGDADRRAGGLADEGNEQPRPQCGRGCLFTD